MRRPISARIWTTRPQWHWYGLWTFVPFSWGGDEFDWHVWTFGWTITGRINAAVRPCPETGRCAGDERPMAQWPIDVYGCDHSKGETR